MTKFRMALPVLAAVGLLVPAGVASAATAAPARPAAIPQVASPFNGCPTYDACMYTRGGWSAGRPEHIYTYDHCYPLSHELGKRDIFNRQTDPETVSGYTTGNCTGSPSWTDPEVPPGFLGEFLGPVNITPINSILLG